MCALVVLAAFSAAPNVVFLSCDTLRADHLEWYGYDKPTAPALKRLAANSLVFDDTVCEVPLTNPSFTSMMTSHVPRMVGTTRNGLHLPKGIPTLAEQFRAAGYYTFCVQSNWTLKSRLSGLDRGFDVYDDSFHKKRWGVLKSERNAKNVARIALELLGRRDPDKPFFAWIHFSDPHAPYKYHKGFNPSGKSRWRMDRVSRTRALYDSEIAYMDHYAGKVIDALPKDNTFIVFVADHGESLYEHNYLGHGRRLYQDNIHIPLMIHGPGVAPGRSDVPARGLDIAPTILGLAGLTPLPEAMGVDLLRSPPPADRPRVIETYGGAVPRLPGAHALMASSGPQRQAVLLNGWKLIVTGRRKELFNVREDPKELKNLAGTDVDRVKKLAALIHNWNTKIPKGHAKAATLTNDDLDALKSLGYLK